METEPCNDSTVFETREQLAIHIGDEVIPEQDEGKISLEAVRVAARTKGWSRFTVRSVKDGRKMTARDFPARESVRIESYNQAS